MKSKTSIIPLLIWYIFLISSVLLFTIVLTANAGVVGTITTNKDLYDINDTILVDFNLSAVGNNTEYTQLYVVGYLPNYNGNIMSETDYFGKDIFFGGYEAVYFKSIQNIKLFDAPEPTSSFIPIPYVRGTFNAFVKPSILDEYKDFLGKVRIFETGSNIYKDVYVTREQPMIILTNVSMERKMAYTDTQTIIINYFCKNNCSITATNIRRLESVTNVFQYGIDSITGQKSLTTSDTNNWKQIVVDLSNSGYTPEDDFIEVKIEDTKGNTDYDYFFVYQPTDAVIRLDGTNYDVGTNTKSNISFNNNIGLVYRTPDTTSKYRIALETAGQQSPITGCNPALPAYFPTWIDISTDLQGVIAPNNGVMFIPLDRGSIFNGFVQDFNCLSDKQELTVVSTFLLNKENKFLWIFPYWSTIGSVTVTFHANRVDMVSPYMIGSPTTEPQKAQLSLKPVIESFGFRGTLGYLLFAIFALAITFFVLVRMANIDPKLALIFNAFEVWYMAYDGIIDWIILVIIVVIVALLYTTKLIKLFRSEPPQQGGDEGEI